MLPYNQQHTDDRQDLLTDPNLFFSDLSDSLNLLNSVELFAIDTKLVNLRLLDPYLVMLY